VTAHGRKVAVVGWSVQDDARPVASRDELHYCAEVPRFEGPVLRTSRPCHFSPRLILAQHLTPFLPEVLDVLHGDAVLVVLTHTLVVQEQLEDLVLIEGSGVSG